MLAHLQPAGLPTKFSAYSVVFSLSCLSIGSPHSTRIDKSCAIFRLHQCHFDGRVLHKDSRALEVGGHY